MCTRCGRRWTSLKWEHCTGCCHTFSGTRAGDAHRKSFRCVDPASVGLVLDNKAVWRLGGANPWKKAREE